MKSKSVFLGLVLLLCFWSFASADSYQMYLKMEGIQGPTSFMGEDGYIEILSYSHGVSQPATSTYRPIVILTSSKYTGPKLESIGNLNEMDLQCVKTMDQTSAKIASAFEKKIKIPSVKLCVLKVVGEQETTWTYELEDVIVTSHAQEGNTETFTFNYGKIEWKNTK